MGADENAAIIRRGYEAFNSGRHGDAHRNLRRETPCGTRPGGARWPANTRAATRLSPISAGWDRRQEGTFRAELQHLLADDQRVVGIQRNSAERDGKHLDVDVCLVFQLKDGRVTEGGEHYRDLYAWDEFWS